MVRTAPKEEMSGMQKLYKSMTLYIKAISKRNEADDKEKSLPVGYLGNVMINHGEDFEHDSDFGRCLIGAPSIDHDHAELALIAYRFWPYT